MRSNFPRIYTPYFGVSEKFHCFSSSIANLFLELDDMGMAIQAYYRSSDHPLSKNGVIELPVVSKVIRDITDDRYRVVVYSAQDPRDLERLSPLRFRETVAQEIDLGLLRKVTGEATLTPPIMITVEGGAELNHLMVCIGQDLFIDNGQIKRYNLDDLGLLGYAVVTKN